MYVIAVCLYLYFLLTGCRICLSLSYLSIIEFDLCTFFDGVCYRQSLSLDGVVYSVNCGSWCLLCVVFSR